MLHKISNLEGCIPINKQQQQTIVGGARRFRSHRRPCNLPYAFYNGFCRLP
ncbi:hypothetical protein H2O64_16355 [Kordia sp. YSTF-M3]|uniref:Uncharacterized protein n=1 Tax=Kordia aestuariivivens TaxID=2759037 RepID=A0ABR7QCH4_9FLAO|nr:hypothetical protein [Kordia aestuariivivens]MBC8756249.1 hypothetical protein [Kordia aestuariivivens]